MFKFQAADWLLMTKGCSSIVEANIFHVVSQFFPVMALKCYGEMSFQSFKWSELFEKIFLLLSMKTDRGRGRERAVSYTHLTLPTILLV